jgi:hypothetical protein
MEAFCGEALHGLEKRIFQIKQVGSQLKSGSIYTGTCRDKNIQAKILE